MQTIHVILHRGGNDTDDKVFLLSMDEVQTYLIRFDRITAPTPFAVRNGAYQSDSGKCWWWLRSPGRSSDYAANVFYDGNLDDRGSHVHDDSNAVCPALWVDLEFEI